MNAVQILSHQKTYSLQQLPKDKETLQCDLLVRSQL